MATFGGQKGFWAKREGDQNPQFISVGGLDTPDAKIEEQKNIWKNRTGVQWTGEDPASIYTDIASGNVKSFTKAAPNAVEDTYLDELLTQVEQESSSARERAVQSNKLLIQQMKDSRELWNKDLEKTYGRALEKANVNVYERGLQDSGVRGEITTDITEEKQTKEKERNLLEDQKRQLASESLKQNLENISQSEKRAKLSFKSPYADYSYLDYLKNNS